MATKKLQQVGLSGIHLTRKSRCSQCGRKFTMAACGPSHASVQAEIERAWWPTGTPRIVTSRERLLWFDGWDQGFADGVKRGRKLERDAARKRGVSNGRG